MDFPLDIASREGGRVVMALCLGQGLLDPNEYFTAVRKSVGSIPTLLNISCFFCIFLYQLLHFTQFVFNRVFAYWIRTNTLLIGVWEELVMQYSVAGVR